LVAGFRRHFWGVAEIREVRTVEHGQDRGKLGAYGRQVLSIAFQGGYQALLGLGQQDMDHARWGQSPNLIRRLERRRHFLAQGEVLGQAVPRAP
jgi:hypothetical protein